MATLNYIGSTANTTYECNGTVLQLINWLNRCDIYQLDVETNVVDNLVERELRVLQFGNLAGDDLWVVQWSHLSKTEQDHLIHAMNDRRQVKLVHNGAFEYTMMRKHGVILENIWDTFVQEKYLYAGHPYDDSYFSLAETLMRRYEIDMSKAMQTQFGDDILTNDKIIYAATDVLHLGKLYLDQKQEYLLRGERMGMSPKEAMRVPYWENAALLGFCDMMYEGFKLDVPMWIENVDKAIPVIVDAKIKLKDALAHGEFSERVYDLDVNAKVTVGDPSEITDDGEVIASDSKERKFTTKAILGEDTMLLNWNSGPQKTEVLQLIFPTLETGSTANLRLFLQENDPAAPKINDKGKPISPNAKFFTDTYVKKLDPNPFSLLKLAILGKYEDLEKILVDNFKKELTELGYFFEKDSMMINWNSNPQKLGIFQWFDPKIDSCDAQCVEDHLHVNKFFPAFRQFTDANSLLTKFGIKFITQHVEPDGRVRTRFDQIKSTGRVSSSSPNMQQIPANALPPERVNDYRNCFRPNYPGWLIVSSDYDSQELAIIATLSGEPAWIDALKTGKDLHSVSAEMVFPQWKDVGLDNCAYYAIDPKTGEPARQKCKCPEHKKLRNNAKSANFGLAYGIAAKGLSVDIDQTVEYTENMMKNYFKAFPNIKRFLDSCGQFGRNFGYIRTPYPLHRVRTFPYWEEKFGDNFWMGKCERASKNSPIQGFAADMTKIALVLIRRWINNNNMQDKIKLVMQVHDQIDSQCHPDVVDIWKPKFRELMELAAKICLKNDLLKADTNASSAWEK